MCVCGGGWRGCIQGGKAETKACFGVCTSLPFSFLGRSVRVSFVHKCVCTHVYGTQTCVHTHTCVHAHCVCVCVCVRMSGTNLYSFLREHACALTGTFTKFREGLCPQNSQTPVLYTPRCSRRSRQSSSPLQSPHTHTHTYTRVYACMHACMHVQERVCIRQSSRPLQTVTDRCRDHANVCLALGVLMHGETPSLVCCTPRCARRSNKIDFVRIKSKSIQTVK